LKRRALSAATLLAGSAVATDRYIFGLRDDTIKASPPARSVNPMINFHHLKKRPTRSGIKQY
jgi:hypothetical protein